MTLGEMERIRGRNQAELLDPAPLRSFQSLPQGGAEPSPFSLSHDGVAEVFYLPRGSRGSVWSGPPPPSIRRESNTSWLVILKSVSAPVSDAHAAGITSHTDMHTHRDAESSTPTTHTHTHTPKQNLASCSLVCVTHHRPFDPLGPSGSQDKLRRPQEVALALATLD